MGLLAKALDRRSAENPKYPLTSSAVLSIFGVTPTATGKTVGIEGSLRSVAVFACVRILAETIGSLPLPVFRRLPGGGKERDYTHALYTILHDQPNPEMTAVELRENLVGHVALWGNAYCEIEYGSRGDVRALWPLRPDRVTVARRNNATVYDVRGQDGQIVTLPKQLVFHVRGFGTDGLVGLSPIAQAREAVGLALATEEFGARFFANDSSPRGVLKHQGRLNDNARKNLRESWQLMHQGLSNAHRVAILEEGVEWQSVGIPPQDAQFLETRKYQTLEIARLFRIPPHMIGDLDRATFSNIEHQSIEFVAHTILPWLVRIEQAIKRDLFLPDERQMWFAKHVVEGLLRGDIKSRYEAYAVGRQWGWLSADDIRELEDMNPLPGGEGKTYLTPLNMQAVGG